MDQWTKYLYANHSENDLKRWASRLKLFRFFRAYGGHANDGDSLDVAVKYRNTEQLLEIFKLIGYTPTIYQNKPSQAVPGKSYSFEEFSLFPNIIDGTKWIKQPGNCQIFDINVFIWCDNDIMTISTNVNSYEVTENHVNSAEKLEEKLSQLSLQIVDPPKDTKHYICPKYHPNIFS